MLSAKSHSRLTLGLDIVGQLSEGEYAGYHELNLVKQEIELHDNIHIMRSEKMQLTCNMPGIPVDSANICWKAAVLLKRQFNRKENVRITIDKQIPPEAGLAAGSSNAATTLKLLVQLWDLDVGREQLVRLGRRLGMDVPFFFVGNTAFDTEATGILNPVSTESGFGYVLVLPEFGVSTKEAYKNINYDEIGKSTLRTKELINGLMTGDRDMVIDNLHNDFETSVIPKDPTLGKIKRDLLHAGCLGALMSGSGSVIFGITDNPKRITDKLKDKYRILTTQTKCQKR